MRVLRVKQGGGAWLKARAGRPTASRMDCIVTPTGKAVSGTKRQSYMHELAAERLMGRCMDHYSGPAAERGTLLEPQARAWYEVSEGVEVQRVGLVLPDHARWACSPDGLVEPDGGLEIKCPLPRQHVAALLNDGADYAVQVQAGIWICERAWWDLVIYTDIDRLPCTVRRVLPDPALQDALAEHVPAFCDDLDALVDRLAEMGAGEAARAAREAESDAECEALFAAWEAEAAQEDGT